MMLILLCFFLSLLDYNIRCVSGLQASSSSQVKVDDVSAAKRPNSDYSEQPHKKKKKKKAAATTAAAACYWWVSQFPSSCFYSHFQLWRWKTCVNSVCVDKRSDRIRPDQIASLRQHLMFSLDETGLETEEALLCRWCLKFVVMVTGQVWASWTSCWARTRRRKSLRLRPPPAVELLLLPWRHRQRRWSFRRAAGRDQLHVRPDPESRFRSRNTSEILSYDNCLFQLVSCVRLQLLLSWSEPPRDLQRPERQTPRASEPLRDLQRPDRHTLRGSEASRNFSTSGGVQQFVSAGQ